MNLGLIREWSWSRNEETRAQVPSLDRARSGQGAWSYCNHLLRPGQRAWKHQGRCAAQDSHMQQSQGPNDTTASRPSVTWRPLYLWPWRVTWLVHPLCCLSQSELISLLFSKIPFCYIFSPRFVFTYAEGKEMKWMFKMVLTLLSASKVLSQTLNCVSSTIAKWSPSCHCGSNLSATHFFHNFQKQETD